MPDLGQYATSVLSAYGIGIVLIIGLTILSLLRAVRIKRQLKNIENRHKKDG